MSNKEVSRVYESIIENVINEVRGDFENNGVDEDTLQALKQIWQDKLSESKAAKFSWDTDLDIDEMHEQQQQQQQQQQEQQQLMPQGEINSVPNTDVSVATVKSELKEGDEVEIEISTGVSEPASASAAAASAAAAAAGEDEQNTVIKKNMEELEMLEKLKQEQKDAKKTALLETDEVNSDLDDSDDDYLNSDDDEQEEGNILLCLYDKVGKVRNKWKWSLRDGIATIDNKDYTFKRANGESEW